MRNINYKWSWKIKTGSEDLWNFLITLSGTTKIFCAPYLNSQLVNETKPIHDYSRKVAGLIQLKWEEDPIVWISPHKMGVLRTFYAGPWEKMKLILSIEHKSHGESYLNVDISIGTISIYGFLLVKIYVGYFQRLVMLKKMMTYNILFSNFSTEQSTPLQNFAPGGEERLFKANEELNKLCKNNDCVSRFIKMVKRADNLSLTRIRPFALADFWQLPRIEVLEVFLHASRLGIFNFKWEQMPLEDKSQEKDTRKFVEITFSVNPGVRNVSDTFFSKEMVTKHTICKGVLLPYEKRVIQIGAKAGIFKLIHANGSSFITVGNRRRKTSTIKLADIQNGETIEIGRAGDIFVKNENSEEQYFALEKIPHSHQAATAYEVTKMQLFNDLFSNEIMKVGEKICMESVTILFTDLRGSTKFYREMGDAQALGHVLSHFEILKHAIEREDGTIIKTIGDAVMATFKRPICAIKAMQNAQEIMKSSDSPLKLKAGIHYGHCIKIASDNYIDYFGNTVNYASRLEGLSHGNDIVISEEVRNDPEIVSLIDQGLMIADGMRANLKGFEDENTNLWRISTNIVAEEELQMSLFQLAS